MTCRAQGLVADAAQFQQRSYSTSRPAATHSDKGTLNPILLQPFCIALYIQGTPPGPAALNSLFIFRVLHDMPQIEASNLHPLHCTL